MAVTRWFALLLLGKALAAQASALEVADRTRALASSDAAIVLAAATAIAEHLAERPDARFTQPLLRALAGWTSTTGADEVRIHLLDALIRGQVKVPPPYLTPLLDDPACGVAAFVLLAREPRANAAELLAIFARDWPNAADRPLPLTCEAARQPTLRALAAGNLLAENNVAGIASSVLATTRLDRIQVTVRPLLGRLGTRADQPRLIAMTPPIPGVTSLVYRLDRIRGPDPDIEPLARGTIDVGFTREIVDPKAQGAISVQLDMTKLLDGLPWLRQLAGAAKGPPCEVDVFWTTADDYRQQVETAREHAADYRALLLDRLVARGALTHEAAQAVAGKPFEIVVDDQRQDSSQPLPTIPDETPAPR